MKRRPLESFPVQEASQSQQKRLVASLWKKSIALMKQVGGSEPANDPRVQAVFREIDRVSQKLGAKQKASLKRWMELAKTDPEKAKKIVDQEVERALAEDSPQPVEEADQVSGTVASRGRYSPDIRHLADPAIKNARLQQIFPELAHLSGKWQIDIGTMMDIAAATIDQGYVPEEFEELLGLSTSEGEIIRRALGDFIFGYAS